MTADVGTVHRWGVAQHDDDDVAATVLLLDGRRYIWRAADLEDDRDVAAWEHGAHDAGRNYVSLYWRDLRAMRSRHN